MFSCAPFSNRHRRELENIKDILVFLEIYLESLMMITPKSSKPSVGGVLSHN